MLHYVKSFLGLKKKQARFIPKPVNDICKEPLWVGMQSLLHGGLIYQPRSALKLC